MEVSGMKTSPFPPARSAAPHRTPVGRVVVIYDAFENALHGQAFCEELAERFGDGESLEEFFWPAHALEDAAVCGEAAAAARRADFVVVALKADAALDDALAEWLRAWMPAAAERDITLVVLQDPPAASRAPVVSVLDFLRATAHRAGVEAQDEPAEPSRTAAELIAGTTILVVDDNLSLLGMAADFLADCGYRVWRAADGSEAKAIIEAQGETLDLVVTDIEMPRLRGDDLAVWIRETHPGLPVLLMSGAEPEAPGTRLLPYLPKPFLLSELLSAIEQVFERVARA